MEIVNTGLRYIFYTRVPTRTHRHFFVLLLFVELKNLAVSWQLVLKTSLILLFNLHSFIYLL